METIIALFLFGTVWFWIFWIVASIVIITGLETEHFIFANIFSLLGLFVLYNNLHLVFQSQLTLINMAIFVFAYLVVGGGWSVFKWWRYTTSALQNTQKELEYNPSSFDRLKDKLARDISVINNKGRITAWIAYWPWSFIWNFLRDAVRTTFDTFEKIYANISSNTLDKLTDKKK